MHDFDIGISGLTELKESELSNIVGGGSFGELVGYWLSVAYHSTTQVLNSYNEWSASNNMPTAGSEVSGRSWAYNNI